MKKISLLLFLMLSALPASAAEPSKPETKKEAAKEEKAPAASGEVVLFDGKSLKDWEMVDIGASGAVELEGGLMIINQGDSISGAVYKKAASLPVTNYEISLEAKRLEGVDFFCGLTFPVGSTKTCATLVCGGWGGAVTGISSIDSLDASENSTSSFVRYEDNKWYAVRVRVTPANLSVWLDGKHIIDQELEGKKVGVRPGPIESYLPLSLTTFATTAAVRNIKLKPVEESKKQP